ncbi:MAG TPA: efflux RND transporter periplasmic adaptor subunit [Hydrogenophaga sp.]|nr:efflux RND transporter periplasmic adaptor subunit [Hydrogenophaga sp.]
MLAANVGLRFVARVLVGCCLLAQAPSLLAQSVTGTDQDGRIRVQLTALNDLVVSSEVAARIERISVRDGDAFRSGALLVSFDCRTLEAQLEKAKASRDGARHHMDTVQRLAELNSVGKLEADQAQAKARETAAEVQMVQSTLSKCRILAPFSGRVVQRMASNHQFVNAGTPLLSLVDTRAIEVRLIVPSRWLSWLKAGAPFQIRLDDLEKTVEAKVARIGARVDPVSQSVELVAVVTGSTAGLLPGMSGWATFPGVR